MKPAVYGALIAAALVCLSGCVDDTEKFTLGEPSLKVLATGGCGFNSAPVLDDGSGSVTVTVTGADPRTPTGHLRTGTTVRLNFTDMTDLTKAYFRSMETSAELVTNSADLPFNGRTATDQVVCFGEGVVNVTATVTEYSIASEGDEERTVELTTAPFPIRCVQPIDYQRECSGLPLIDAGVDMAIPEDVGVDAGDAAQPPAWSIRFLPPASEADLQIGIKDSAFGRPDNVLLRFQVLDLNGTTNPSGDPLPDQPVRFRLSPNPPPNVAVDPGMAVTDENGIVSVRLLAGGTPGVVSVEAETVIDDGDALVARSATVLIRGGIPSASGFQFLCEQRVIPGFINRPTWDNYIFGLGRDDGTLCVAQLADRVAGRVDLATQVFYLTEAGSVDQAGVTDGSGLSNTFLRIGPPAPYEIVNPSDEELDQDQRLVDSNMNPRDGLVTVVAVTRGEEDFVDTNGNKVWDDGLDYQLGSMDLPEPCVDVNDDGECTTDLPIRGEEDYAEIFRDTDGDGIWSEGNGVWDKDTEIWKATHVLWVGQYSEYKSTFTVDCRVTSGCSLQPAQGNCPGLVGEQDSIDEGTGLRPMYFLSPGGSLTLNMRVTDPNGNCLDGYGQGSTFIELGSSLASAANITNRTFSGACFTDGILTRPEAPTHVYQIFDTAGDSDEAVFSTITFGVEHTTVGSGTENVSYTIGTCR